MINTGAKILTKEDADKLTGINITIPDGYNAIGKEAFANRTRIRIINIPKGISAISDDAFINSTLIKFCVDENNSEYSSLDGVLFNKDKTVLVAYPSRKAQTLYRIPDGVTMIGENAFFGCKNLEYVDVPDSVISAGKMVGHDCLIYFRCGKNSCVDKELNGCTEDDHKLLLKMKQKMKRIRHGYIICEDLTEDELKRMRAYDKMLLNKDFDAVEKGNIFFSEVWGIITFWEVVKVTEKSVLFAEIRFVIVEVEGGGEWKLGKARKVRPIPQKYKSDSFVSSDGKIKMVSENHTQLRHMSKYVSPHYFSKGTKFDTLYRYMGGALEDCGSLRSFL